MDIPALFNIAQESVMEYSNLKLTESYYLFQHNKDYLQSKPRITVRCKQPVQASDIKFLNTTTKSYPALNGTHYHPTNIYKMKDDTVNLTRIPLTKNSKNVLNIQRLCLYKTHPFKLQDPCKVIEGKQFALFLCVKILQTQNLSLEKMKNLFYDVLLKLAKKNIKLADEIFSTAIKLLNSECIPSHPISDFNEKFCRICKLFCCITHFANRVENGYENSEVHETRSVKMTKIDPYGIKHKRYINIRNVNQTGKWLIGYICRDSFNCFKSNSERSENSSLSDRAEFILKVFLRKGIKNPCSISMFIQNSCRETAYFIQQYKDDFIPAKNPIRILKTVYTDSSKHNSSIIPTSNLTCQCDSKCGMNSDCSCFSDNKHAPFICNKYCECSLTCNKKFLGCNCQFGQCNTETCVCFANSRECDPDLCLSCCSILAIQLHKNNQYSSKPGSFSLCKNVQIQRRIKKRTGLSISTIPHAGLGLFALENIKSGEVITEYTGELISASEFEKMGDIYDNYEHSYLLGKEEMRIDATYFGNKMKYANHKSHNQENCSIHPWSVNGNSVMILRAKKNIKKGQELFFNYGYDLDQISFKWYHEYENKIKSK